MQISPKRDALLVSLIFLISASVSVFSVAKSASRQMLHEYQNMVEIVAKSAAVMTNGELHKTLTLPEQKHNAAYTEIQKNYISFLDANPQVAYIYTVVLKEGNPYFVIDTKQPRFKTLEGDKEDTANVMELYDDASPYGLKALHHGIVTVEDRPYSDKWGSFFSAYAPFYDAGGQLVGVVGVDFDGEDYKHHIHDLWLMFANGSLISLLLSMGIYIIVLDYRRKQLHRRALRDGFNFEMQNHTKYLSDAAQELHKESITISGAVEETAKFASTAMTNIYGTANRINSVATTSEVMVKSLDEFRSMIESYRLEIASANEQVSQAQDTVNKLVASNDQVNQMVAEIPKITGKINLLALNATIESARAGEAGKGFAVVASEVKTLAGQTYDVTKNVSSYLVEGKEATDKTAHLVGWMTSIIGRAQKMVEGTSKMIDEHHELLSAVNDDIQEVSTLTATMENSIKELNEKSDGTENSVKQLNTDIQTLSEMNTKLNTRVSTFLEDFEAKHRNLVGKK